MSKDKRHGRYLCLVENVEYSGGRGSRPVITGCVKVPGILARMVRNTASRRLSVSTGETLGLEASSAAMARLLDGLDDTQSLSELVVVHDADSLIHYGSEHGDEVFGPQDEVRQL